MIGTQSQALKEPAESSGLAAGKSHFPRRRRRFGGDVDSDSADFEDILHLRPRRLGGSQLQNQVHQDNGGDPAPSERHAAIDHCTESLIRYFRSPER